MNYLFTISFRNLLRQKRRNIMLGIAIAVGVMILIVASSFSHGISDIMFNKIIVWVTGHASIEPNEGSGKRAPIFRDRERLLSLIKANVSESELKDVDEGIGQFMKALGNGRSDNIVLVGIDMSKTYTEEQQKEFDESFHLTEGKFDDLISKDIENPVILPAEKARILNVKKNDFIRIRYRNVYGQDQAGRLTVVGIMSAENMFMQGVMFTELQRMKKLMGYREYESGSFQIILNNPARDAVKVADRLHSALKSGPAFIYGNVKGSRGASPVTVLPFMGDLESKKLIKDSFQLTSGKMDRALGKKGVMVSGALAKKIGAVPGKKITIKFQPKFKDKKAEFSYAVQGIFKPDKSTGKNTIYMHEAEFYPDFYDNLPDLTKTASNAFIPDESVSFKKALGTEWVLFDRSRTSDDSKKKMRAASKKKIKAATLDVNTMYERASDVLKLEGALNLISFFAVMILFIIILIGVINTLRMTIRERTREIGTIRAIGMQRRDVRRIFLLETAFLTLFASISGTVLGFILMGILSLFTIDIGDNPLGMLLVNGRLHFVPTLGSIAGNILFILLIALITAYFPARRAAKMSASRALRHYE